MTPGFTLVALKIAGIKSLTRVVLEDCQEDLASLLTINLWLWQMSVLIESLPRCLSFPTIFNNQVQPVPADGEAFGSCTSGPSVAFGSSISPQSPLLPRFAPLLFLPLCGFLFPLSRFLRLYLFLIFGRRSSVCHRGCLGKQTGEGALGEPDGMLRVSVCRGWSRAGESFLKMCEKRSKAQRRDCNTNICTASPPRSVSSAWCAFSSSSAIEIKKKGIVLIASKRWKPCTLFKKSRHSPVAEFYSRGGNDCNVNGDPGQIETFLKETPQESTDLEAVQRCQQS